ncbi:MAG: carboxymuconolactone decarboxylase family protein [Gammaproteobacteria bacterium]|nr:carboxymuconolactone decarboxylase family protein [Gammaproteobacteria bacterium]
MPLLDPLPAGTTPELADKFATFARILGFVPNSLLTMQRKPEIVAGFEALTRAVMAPEGEVDLGFKRLVAHFCSRAAGCEYCMAHSLIAAEIHGIAADKVDAVWDYAHSPLYSQAERAALDFALAAGSVPNAVDEPLMQRMRTHWSEGAIVEILAVVALYGFLNRWNDSMATPIEPAALAMGQRALASHGWSGGKHRARTSGD